MNSNPKVTVVMATYNWSTVLPYSIGSVLRQTLADFELRVVGDACTDDSEEVVRSFDDPRVLWHNLPVNYGQQGGPNNEGILHARGEYIAYIGHDDLWLPHHLEALIPALESGTGFAWGLVACVLPQNQRRELIPNYPREYKRHMWIPPTGLVHRKDLAEKAGGWRSYREIAIDPESDLISRIHQTGAKGRFVPRLTAIKFPAAMRKDVYRERPCHEQSSWTMRMLNGEDIERQELVDAAIRPRAVDWLRILRGKLNFLSRSLILGYKRGIFDHRRKFKGLDPKT